MIWYVVAFAVGFIAGVLVFLLFALGKFTKMRGE